MKCCHTKGTRAAGWPPVILWNIICRVAANRLNYSSIYHVYNTRDSGQTVIRECARWKFINGLVLHNFILLSLTLYKLRHVLGDRILRTING